MDCKTKYLSVYTSMPSRKQKPRAISPELKNLRKNKDNKYAYLLSLVTMLLPSQLLCPCKIHRNRKPGEGLPAHGIEDI